METIQPTTPETLGRLMETYPQLCATGWRQPKATESEFAALRDELSRSVDKVDLCRRMYRDPRFLQDWHGHRTAYHLKHIAETWDFEFDPDLFPHRHCYNGYVNQGIAAAAALLEEFEVTQEAPGAPGSFIAVSRARSSRGSRCTHTRV